MLKPTDIPSRRTVMTIDHEEVVKMPQTGDTHCLFFTGYEKPLPLNKTNLAKMVELFGDDSDNWKEKKIALTKEKANNPNTNVAVDTFRVYGENE